jgi:hypothetical protein
MGFFDSLWGWADYEPKDWSGAAYKTAFASSGDEVANFFALLWGWADYEPKDWSRTAHNSTRRRSVSYGWFG